MFFMFIWKLISLWKLTLEQSCFESLKFMKIIVLNFWPKILYLFLYNRNKINIFIKPKNKFSSFAEFSSLRLFVLAVSPQTHFILCYPDLKNNSSITGGCQYEKYYESKREFIFFLSNRIQMKGSFPSSVYYSNPYLPCFFFHQLVL